jgi:Tol biopolymer transport system component
MAPEQAKGKVVDKRADIWAFGVVLYELLTGRQLFQGEDVSDTLAHVLTKQPEWDQVPDRARRLLRDCLEKDPKQRLRDIGDAKRLVTEVAADPAHSVSRSSHVLRNVAWIVAALSIASAAGVSFLHFREAPPSAPEIVRYSISVPNLGGFPNLSVSPDGRRVVFRALTGSGARLWVHSLDSLDSRPLTGTEEVNGLPFWSPDSRWVVFGAQGKLKKIEAFGGPPQTLCEIPGNLRGGFWTSDNRIVFGTASGGLRQVAAGGGTPTPVTIAESGPNEAPALLGDERHFVSARGGGGENDGIYLGSLDAKPEAQGSKRLLAGFSQPAYAPPSAGGVGHILFVREGTLMAQPLDSAGLQLAGDAVPVAEQVAANQVGEYSISSTGVLVYANGGGGGGRQLTWYDRQGKPGDNVWTPGAYNELTLSPDATRVAVVRAGPAETWIFEFARGASTRLTPSGGTQQVWSPDGNRVVFRSAGTELHIKAASGAGNEDVLLKASHAVQAKDWSRDGRFLLYEEQDPKTKWDLWVLPVAAGAAGEGKPVAFLHSEFNETDGKFAPDGRFVAYVSDESGKSEVYVSPFPDPKGGKVTISNGGGYQPRWRRDGKELLYFTGDGKLMSVDVTLSPAFKAAAPKVLFQAPIWGGGASTNQDRWDMTPDGKRFLINTIAGETSTPLTVVLNWQAALKK